MKIFAKSVTGEIILLDVTKSEKIIDLKKKIENVVGLISSEQKLVYQARILEDDKTVHYYRISENCYINVIDRLCNVMPIIINSMDRKSFELEVSKSQLIIDVKKKIQNKIGQLRNELTLIFNGRRLDDDETVEYYQFFEKCILILIVSDLSYVNIKPKTGESLRLAVKSSDTIIQIKKNIKELTKIHLCEQILTYKDVVLSNRMTISDYKISDNGTINLTLKDALANEIGLCVVISNEKFVDNLKNRPEARTDEKTIIETFKPLGFEMQVHRDVTLSAIGEIFKQIAEQIKETNRLLLVFVLSHGEKEHFITSDGIKFPFKDTWLPFSNTNFPKLSGRPKLFFFVCCQGETLAKDEVVDSPSCIHSDNNNMPPVASDAPLETMADLFLGFSTSHSSSACSDCDKRSYYVKSLCDVISKKPEWSICLIHQEVQRRLSIKSFVNDGFQKPYYINYLSNPAYLIN